eukprot:8113-Heterococcus_DN1.PRE.2
MGKLILGKKHLAAVQNNEQQREQAVRTVPKPSGCCWSPSLVLQQEAYDAFLNFTHLYVHVVLWRLVKAAVVAGRANEECTVSIAAQHACSTTAYISTYLTAASVIDSHAMENAASIIGSTATQHRKTKKSGCQACKRETKLAVLETAESYAFKKGNEAYSSNECGLLSDTEKMVHSIDMICSTYCATYLYIMVATKAAPRATTNFSSMFVVGFVNWPEIWQKPAASPVAATAGYEEC